MPKASKGPGCNLFSACGMPSMYQAGSGKATRGCPSGGLPGVHQGRSDPQVSLPRHFDPDDSVPIIGRR
jgi:hypothetical protein